MSFILKGMLSSASDQWTLQIGFKELKTVELSSFLCLSQGKRQYRSPWRILPTESINYVFFLSLTPCTAKLLFARIVASNVVDICDDEIQSTDRKFHPNIIPGGSEFILPIFTETYYADYCHAWWSCRKQVFQHKTILASNSLDLKANHRPPNSCA